MGLFAKQASGSSKSVENTLRVYEVKTGEVFVKNSSIASMLSEIERGALIDDGLFLQTYRSLVLRFCEQVQLISSQAHGINTPYLLVALKRAFIHWSSFREMIIAQYDKRYLSTDEGSRLLFAVFSSSLLFEISKLDVNQKIILCNEEGAYVGTWQLILKSMVHYGRYYRIGYGQTRPMASLLAPQTHILAKHIMPDFGYLWLQEDARVLDLWFKALVLEEVFFGAYRMEFDFSAWLGQFTWFDQNAYDQSYHIAKGLEDAQRFWHWVTEELEKQTLADDHLVFLDGALMIDLEKLAKVYAEKGPGKGDKAGLIASFSDLGYADIEKEGRLKFYALHHNEQNMQAGMTKNRLFDHSNLQKNITDQAQANTAINAQHFVKINKQNTTFYLEKALGAGAVAGLIQNSAHWASAENEHSSSTETLSRVGGLLGLLVDSFSAAKGF